LCKRTDNSYTFYIFREVGCSGEQLLQKMLIRQKLFYTLEFYCCHSLCDPIDSSHLTKHLKNSFTFQHLQSWNPSETGWNCHVRLWYNNNQRSYCKQQTFILFSLTLLHNDGTAESILQFFLTTLLDAPHLHFVHKTKTIAKVLGRTVVLFPLLWIPSLTNCVSWELNSGDDHLVVDQNMFNAVQQTPGAYICWMTWK
jgi:hypothetical protein